MLAFWIELFFWQFWRPSCGHGISSFYLKTVCFKGTNPDLIAVSVNTNIMEDINTTGFKWGEQSNFMKQTHSACRVAMLLLKLKMWFKVCCFVFLFSVWCFLFGWFCACFLSWWWFWWFFFVSFFFLFSSMDLINHIRQACWVSCKTRSQFHLLCTH